MAPKVMRVESDTFCDTSIHKTKGQLISKGLFGILNPPKRIQLYYYDPSGRFVFGRFLGEIEDTKKTFPN